MLSGYIKFPVIALGVFEACLGGRFFSDLFRPMHRSFFLRTAVQTLFGPIREHPRSHIQRSLDRQCTSGTVHGPMWLLRGAYRRLR